MRIVCAESVLLGPDTFSRLGKVVVIPDHAMNPENIAGSDALIVRSKTVVDAALLTGTGIRFVGTATAGTDHMDTDWLQQAGIHWVSAAGCNAVSVAEWVLTAMSICALKTGAELPASTLGIVGAGHCGKALANRAAGLGMQILLNDPPRSAIEGSSAFTELGELLARSDFVSLHVPLVRSGRWPTQGLANEPFFKNMKRGAVMINASRGEVLHLPQLLDAMDKGTVEQVALDVFPDEPNVDPGLANRLAFMTPHIAGYSYDGRLAGTRMVFEALSAWAESTIKWTDPASAIPSCAAIRLIELEDVGSAVFEAATLASGLLEDDAAFRAGLFAGENPSDLFNRLRKNYRCRREFPASHLKGPLPGSPSHRALQALGFSFSTSSG